MKKFIKKILKEQDSDFDWVDDIDSDPQEVFSDYFNKNRDTHFRYSLDYWSKWVNNVELAIYSLYEDVEELSDFTKKLIDNTTKPNEFKQYLGYVWDVVKPQPSLNGESFLSDTTKIILNANKKLGSFMESTGLSLIDTLFVFKTFLKTKTKK